MKQEMMQVLSNKEIAKNIFEMKLSGQICQKIKEPGQFIHIKLADQSMLLRRPLSISSYNQEELSILYKVVGSGTKALTRLNKDDYLDVLGPLGNGFKVDVLPPQSKILIVGAGIGIAPLYELSKQVFNQGYKLDIVLSFMSAEEAYYIEEFKALGKVHVSTDDGSLGMKGYCEDLVKSLTKDFDCIYACGPLIVLKFIQEHFKDLEHVYLSLEERMACGFGVCHGCDTKDKKKLICKSGPIFKGSEVTL